MHHNRSLKRYRRRASALVALLLVLGAPAAQAGNGPVNAPPPMPEAMRSGEFAASEAYGAMPLAGESQTAVVNGKTVSVRKTPGEDAGFALPAPGGNYVWTSAPAAPIPAGLADARELRLKVRELASQLIANMDPAYRGMVALPTSFVNQEDFSQTSPLGRFIAEQLFYEFNQRGFPVREYRMGSSIAVRDGQGEFLLTRKVPSVSAKTKGALFVAGTYFIDRQAVFLNARLLCGDGSVVRTAQVMLPGTAMTRRMVAGGGKTLKKGSLPIRDFETTTQPTNLTPFDQGEDIH